MEWLFPLGSVQDSSYPEFIEEVGALAMGATTYEWILRNADAVAAETGSPWPYTQPAWVFTHRSLPTVPDANVKFMNGDVRPVHAEMCHAANVSYWTPTNVDCGSRQPAARRLDAHQRNGWTFLNGSGWTFMGRPFWTSSKSLVPESAVPQPP